MANETSSSAKALEVFIYLKIQMTSIIEELDWYIKESFPMIYNEEKEQDNKINKANAELIFKPKFIPVIPELLQILTPMEALLYWFISFYNTRWNRFYFTNKQLWELLSCADETITRLIKWLEDKWLIKTKRKIKANWGLIRFVTDINTFPKLTNCQLADWEKVKEIDNKIKYNKINNKNNTKDFSDLLDYVDKWNWVDELIQNKRKVKWLPKTIKITKQIKKLREEVVKEYTVDEIKQATNKYIAKIEKTVPNENRDWTHRYTLYEFLKRQNWLQKYINS